MTTQQHHLARVADNIGATVIRFCRMYRGMVFTAAELRGYVTCRHPSIAPDSAGRILRDLRQRRIVRYRLVSRARSLYRVIGVREGA